jgi:Tfp pilus assembly protein PilN
MSTNLSNSFLPADYLRRKRESRALILNLALFVGMIGLVGGAFIVTNRQWTEVRGEQQRVNAEYEAEAAKIEQLKKLDEQRQDLMYRAEVTNALIERVLRSVLLAEVVNRMPPTATISELALESSRAPEAPVKAVVPQAGSLTGGGGGEAKKEVVRKRPLRLEFKLSITGLCANDTEVADFQTALMKSPLLDRVDLMSTVEHIVGDRQMRRFRIEAGIRPDADTSVMTPLAVKREADPVRAAEAKLMGLGGSGASSGGQSSVDPASQVP